MAYCHHLKPRERGKFHIKEEEGARESLSGQTASQRGPGPAILSKNRKAVLCLLVFICFNSSKILY